MPSKTFLNIRPEKRNKIIEAGADLFAARNFEDVDVKTVVEKAGLPRGSFYAYFADMGDYYNTVIASLQAERLAMIEKKANGFSGSVFDFLLELFINDLKGDAGSRRALLQRHYFRYLQMQKLGSFKDTPYHPDQRSNLYMILSAHGVGFGENRFAPEKQGSLFEWCMTVFLSTYNQTTQEQLTETEGIRLFEERIRIIERGIRK